MPKTLAKRVTDLEKTVEPLRELPARVTRLELRVTAVEEQVVQLRGEMRDGFSAVLEVIEAASAATEQLFEDTRTQMATFHTETKQGLASLGTEMRVLHEDVVERIARIGEGGQRRKRREPRN